MENQNNGSESSFNFSSSSALHFPLVSNNSFEVNAISLSDDSGFTSSQLNRENDHADFNSDEFEEFSQFDSDSGLSAENCHTIKKNNQNCSQLPANSVIEPPPEFADNNFNSKFNSNNNNFHSSAPSTVIRTTHIQSYASRMAQNIIAKAIRTFDRKHLGRKEIYCERHAAEKLKKQQKHNKTMENDYIHKNRFVTNGYSIYGSDSFLNSFKKTQNFHLISNGKNSNSNINIDDEDIYDEPNTEYDVIYKDNKDTILCTKRIVRSLEKKKIESRHLYCNTDDLFCEKVKVRNSCTTATSPSIENKFQSNSFQKKFDKFLRSKFLNSNFTPTTTTSSIFYSFCRSGTNNSNPCYPNSRTSLNSRLSSSHNSLTKSSNKADDSMFITQAMSHDQLGKSSEMNDFYNVPMDSDIYTLPVDVINQNDDEDDTRHNRRQHNHHHHHHHRHRAMSDNNLLECSSSRGHKNHNKHKRSKRKKRSDAGHSIENSMRKITSGNFVNSQSFSHDYNRVSSDRTKSKFTQTSIATHNNNGTMSANFDSSSTKYRHKNSLENSSKSVNVMIKGGDDNNNKYSTNNTNKKSQFSISLNLKQKFCSIFRFRKSQQSLTRANNASSQSSNETSEKKVNLSTRALPPLPPGKENDTNITDGTQSPTSEKKRETTMDFAANIEKVRECGWYWGALTSEAAEKILSNEPDGSFIVRDSSDLNYIFSLTVKLNGCIRHVRIEQEQGTFSFGTCAQQIKCSYKSRTIKEFIENAVEHSRSGRYLFFIHRRPEHGPMRVQLLNPVSRFKHIQSLQHMCRFVIVKAVQRKDLIETLPLPRRLLDYLQTKNFLSELIDSDSSSQSQIYGDNNNNNNNSDSN